MRGPGDVATVFEPGDHAGARTAARRSPPPRCGPCSPKMRRIDAPALAAAQGAKLAAAVGALPGVALGARPWPAARRRARERGRGTGALELLASGLVTSNCDADRAPAGPAAHRDRLGARRGRRDHGSGAGVTRHLLEVADLTAEEIRRVLQLGWQPVESLGRPLAGRGAALIFEKASAPGPVIPPSLPVVSSEVTPIYARGDEIGMDERESVEDVVRILQGYRTLIAARVFSHDVLLRMVDVATRSDRQPSVRSSPSVAGDRRRHDHGGGARTRSLAGPWRGSATITTSPARSARCALLGAGALRLPVRVPRRRRGARAPGIARCGIGVADAPAMAAVSGADAVHADTWVSMGQEEDAATRSRRSRASRSTGT